MNERAMVWPGMRLYKPVGIPQIVREGAMGLQVLLLLLL